jgi:hypothetical protein
MPQRTGLNRTSASLGCKCIYTITDGQVTGTLTIYLHPRTKHTRNRRCDKYCEDKYCVNQNIGKFKITCATGEVAKTNPPEWLVSFIYEFDGGKPDVRKVEADGMDLKDLPQDNYQSDVGESGVMKAEPEEQPTSACPCRKSESDKAGLEKQQTPRRNSYPQDKYQFNVGEPGVMEAEPGEQPTSARPRKRSELDKAG